MPAGKCAFECVLYEIVGAFLIAAQQCVGEAAQPRYLRLEQSGSVWHCVTVRHTAVG